MVREPDEFKEVYDDLRPILESKDDEEMVLSKPHIVTFVNTILRRKRFNMSTKEMFAAFFYNNCCSKR